VEDDGDGIKKFSFDGKEQRFYKKLYRAMSTAEKILSTKGRIWLVVMARIGGDTQATLG